MSNNNKESNRPISNKEDAQQLYIIIGRLIYNFISSTRILGLLTTKPVIGNIVIIALAANTGLSIFEDANAQEENVNKIDINALCNGTKKEMALRLDIDSSDMENIVAVSNSINDTSRNDRKIITSCNYSLTGESEKRTYHILQRLQRDKFSTKIREAKIAIEDLEEVCKGEEIREKQLLSENFYNPEIYGHWFSLA